SRRRIASAAEEGNGRDEDGAQLCQARSVHQSVLLREVRTSCWACVRQPAEVAGSTSYEPFSSARGRVSAPRRVIWSDRWEAASTAERGSDPPIAGDPNGV